FSRLRPGRSCIGPCVHFTTQGERGERHHEPALRGREPLHAHGCDGRPSPSLSRKPNCALRARARRKDPGCDQGPWPGFCDCDLQVPAGAATFDDQWLSGAANDLAAKPGASLVLAGPDQPGAVQLLVYAINAALKNLGQTLVIRQVPRNPRTIDILQLAMDMNDGRIKRLFILGGDPVYNAPRGLAEDRETKFPLDWGDVQKKVPEIVRLGYHEDATS